MNILFILVTRAVSKSSTWLNLTALCRVAREGTKRDRGARGPGARGRRVAAVLAACREGLGWRPGRGHAL